MEAGGPQPWSPFLLLATGLKRTAGAASAKQRGQPMHDAEAVAVGVSELREHPPIVTFFRFVPECRLPMRADRAAAGTMPTRAFRHCEAMTSASAFGWYVFPPITFSLMWDGGSEIFWTFKGEDAWFPLSKVQFPGFADHFDKTAPAE